MLFFTFIMTSYNRWCNKCSHVLNHMRNLYINENHCQSIPSIQNAIHWLDKVTGYVTKYILRQEFRIILPNTGHWKVKCTHKMFHKLFLSIRTWLTGRSADLPQQQFSYRYLIAVASPSAPPGGCRRYCSVSFYLVVWSWIGNKDVTEWVRVAVCFCACSCLPCGGVCLYFLL